MLQQQIAALSSQRQQETGNLVGAGDNSVAATLQAYEDIRIQSEFALQAYTAAFALAEAAKLEAGKQEKFLLLIAPPHLPEEPVFPSPIKGVLTVFICSSVLFGIGRLVISTIRDHSI
jgi:capsular polysaccharide transport system permease protein